MFGDGNAGEGRGECGVVNTRYASLANIPLFPSSRSVIFDSYLRLLSEKSTNLFSSSSERGLLISAAIGENPCGPSVWRSISHQSGSSPVA